MSQGSALPKYLGLSEMLIREIAAGHLPDGTRLPPEREMAAEHGVSVGTLRKALADIEEKGLLTRVQGSGNYIRAGEASSAVYAFFRLELLRGGGLPTARVLSVSREAKPADAPDFGPSPQAHRIRRVRALGGTEIALEEIWLDGDRAAGIAAADLSESLYLYYRDQLGLVIATAEDRVGLGAVPGWAGEDFHLAAGAPAGLIERIGRAQDGARVEYSRTWFDADRARYVSRMGKG